MVTIVANPNLSETCQMGNIPPWQNTPTLKLNPAQRMRERESPVTYIYDGHFSFVDTMHLELANN